MGDRYDEKAMRVCDDAQRSMDGEGPTTHDDCGSCEVITQALRQAVEEEAAKVKALEIEKMKLMRRAGLAQEEAEKNRVMADWGYSHRDNWMALRLAGSRLLHAIEAKDKLPEWRFKDSIRQMDDALAHDSGEKKEGD